MTQQKYLYKSLILTKKNNFYFIYTYNYIGNLNSKFLIRKFNFKYLHSFKANKTIFSTLIILQHKYKIKLKLK